MDPLRDASAELRGAVAEMGGDAFLAAVGELVSANEEWTVDWFDAQWDDLAAEEIFEWSVQQLARTSATVAHAALAIALTTYAVDEDDEDAAAGNATIVTAFIRVKLAPVIDADRYALDFRTLGEWIKHDAIRVAEEPS